MSVLITGNDTRVMKSIATKLCEHNKVVVVGKNDYSGLNNRINTFAITPSDEMFEKLFQSHQFETVIFVTSRHMRDKIDNRGEMDDLRRVLQLASQEETKQVICISSSIVYSYGDNSIYQKNYKQDNMKARSKSRNILSNSKVKESARNESRIYDSLSEVTGTYAAASLTMDPPVFHTEGTALYANTGSIGRTEYSSLISEDTNPNPTQINGILLSSCEQLCKFYRENNHLNTVILHVPYLYGNEGCDLITDDLLREYNDNKQVRLPGTPQYYCDFVSEGDLSDMLERLIDDPYSLDSGVINIGSGRPFPFKLLVEYIKKLLPKVKIEFDGKFSEYPVPVTVETARKYYDWVPVDDFFTKLSEYIGQYIELHSEKVHWKDKLMNLRRSNSVITRTIELLLGFLLVEYLNNTIQATAQLRFADFRLLYIVLFGSIYGMRTGITAAILAGISYLLGTYKAIVEWEILFYNAENWLPLVAYFIAGGVIGHSRDKYIINETLMKNKLITFEERYLFLYELYNQTLANKNTFKEQIIGYRDSFGRIYDAVRKLESEEQEEIFLKATQVLEDVMETKSVAIYSVDATGTYARLVASSEGMMDRIDKSLKLSDHNQMLQKLQENEIWCNQVLNEIDPMYCSAICDNGRIVALIALWDASFHQMTAAYLNLFQVLSGLVQTSIIRAVRFNAVVGQNKYLANTQILKSEEFAYLLNIKELMQENNIAKYKLLRVDMQIDNLTWFSDTVLSSIRGTDAVGQQEDGNFYILLSQADDSNVGLMIERLNKRGIVCSIEKG